MKTNRMRKFLEKDITWPGVIVLSHSGLSRILSARPPRPDLDGFFGADTRAFAWSEILMALIPLGQIATRTRTGAKSTLAFTTIRFRKRPRADDVPVPPSTQGAHRISANYTYYVFGIGEQSSTYYPFTFKADAGTLLWGAYYQTADT